VDESQTVYSTKQLADSLGLGSAMVRKYAVALETVTGQEIPLKRRDGRQFSREHFDVISRAKALVDSNNGLSVDTALKMVLSGPENAANALASPKALGSSLELTEALSAAIARGNEPLLAELRELRQELRETRQVETPVKANHPQEDSAIISAAKRLDSLVKRFFRA
jgi:hypothetical protein